MVDDTVTTSAMLDEQVLSDTTADYASSVSSEPVSFRRTMTGSSFIGAIAIGVSVATSGFDVASYDRGPADPTYASGNRQSNVATLTRPRRRRISFSEARLLAREISNKAKKRREILVEREAQIPAIWEQEAWE